MSYPKSPQFTQSLTLRSSSSDTLCQMLISKFRNKFSVNLFSEIGLDLKLAEVVKERLKEGG
jgi:hypothetical protein